MKITVNNILNYYYISALVCLGSYEWSIHIIDVMSSCMGHEMISMECSSWCQAVCTSRMFLYRIFSNNHPSLNISPTPLLWIWIRKLTYQTAAFYYKSKEISTNWNKTGDSSLHNPNVINIKQCLINQVLLNTNGKQVCLNLRVNSLK